MHKLKPLLTFSVALVLSMFALAAALSVLGHRPDSVLGAILTGAFGSKFALSETLLKLVPVLLCALAAAIPAESGQVNIGGEGQFHLGAIGAVVAATLFSGQSTTITMVLMVTFAILFGAGWGAVPGALRAFLGVNEALVALFLNYIAIYLLQYLVHGPMKDPVSLGWPMSPQLDQGILLTPILGTRLHTGVIVVLLLALAVIAVMYFTKSGKELTAVGENPRTSSIVGIPVSRYLWASMMIGGALAAFAGYYEIAAVQHRLRSEASTGFGYSGFLVAWMCRRQVYFIIPISLIVAGLISSSESLQITTGLPAASSDVAQGFLLLFVLLGASINKIIRRRLEIRKVIGGASV
jgi:simple sugar transport system permease protein